MIRPTLAISLDSFFSPKLGMMGDLETSCGYGDVLAVMAICGLWVAFGDVFIRWMPVGRMRRGPSLSTRTAVKRRQRGSSKLCGAVPPAA